MRQTVQRPKFQMLVKIFFFLVLTVHLGSALENPSDESKLVKKLLSNYNKIVRPAHDSFSPVEVALHARVIQVIDFDEKNQVITWNMWVRQTWNDYRLKWNQSEYTVDRIVLNPLLLWVPDIYLYNNAQENYRGFDYDVEDGVVVTSAGDVLWWTQAIMKSTCKFSVRFFPFDEQHCELQFGSWTHSGSQLNLTLFSTQGDMSQATKNGEWVLVDFQAVRNVVYYKCCPEPYPSVTFTLTARRRSNFYLSNFMLPCTLVALISVLAFCLPYKSGERVNLLITSLLSLTIFSLMISDMIPATPDGTPLFSQFMIAILVEISIALTVICMIIALETKWTPPSSFVRHFLNRCLASLVRVHSNSGHQLDVRAMVYDNVASDGCGSINPHVDEFDSDNDVRPKRLSKIIVEPLDILSIDEEKSSLSPIMESCSKEFQEKLHLVLKGIADNAVEKMATLKSSQERLALASKIDKCLHAFFTIIVILTICVTLSIPPELNL